MDRFIIFLLVVGVCFSCQKHRQIDPAVLQDLYAEQFDQKSDSILEVYYRTAVEQKDSVLLCSLNYIRGRLYQQKYVLFAAQDYYERARSMADRYGTPKLQIDLYLNLAEIYRFNKQYDYEQQMLAKSLVLSEQENDTTAWIRILQHCGERNKMQHCFRQALDDYGIAANLTRNNPDRASLYASLCGELALLHLYEQRYDSAQYWIGEAIETQTGNQDFFIELQNGLKHHLAGSDSTEVYFKRLTERFPLHRRADAFRYMADEEFRKGQILRAYTLLRDYVILKDSLDSDRREFVIERMQALRAYRAKQKQTEETERLLGIRMLQIYRLAAVLLVLIILGGLFYIYIKRRQARLLLFLEQSERAKAEENLLRREAELRWVKEQEHSERLEKERLEQRIGYFKRLNEITIPLLMQHRNRTGALHFSEEDWETLRQNTDACFERFTDRLRAAYPQLSNEEINFCCLVKMELPLAVLAEIYHIAKGSISRKKMRLKEKMGIYELSFDEWIMNF